MTTTPSQPTGKVGSTIPPIGATLYTALSLKHSPYAIIQGIITSLVSIITGIIYIPILLIALIITVGIQLYNTFLIKFGSFFGRSISLNQNVWSNPKTIFVTGGAQGIGLGLATEWVNKGVTTVILTDINTEQLKNAKTTLENHFQTQVLPNWSKTQHENTSTNSSSQSQQQPTLNVITQVMDVTNRQQTRDTMVKLDDLYKIDVVLCNAGVAPHCFEHLSFEEQMRKTIDINISGVINTFYPLRNRFRSRKQGQFVLSGSASGFGTFIGSAYPASKAFVNTFGRTQRILLSRDNISVVTLTPGFIKTPMLDKLEGLGEIFPNILNLKNFCQTTVDCCLVNESQIYTPWSMYLIFQCLNPLGPKVIDLLALISTPPEEGADKDVLKFIQQYEKEEEEEEEEAEIGNNKREEQDNSDKSLIVRKTK